MEHQSTLKVVSRQRFYQLSHDVVFTIYFSSGLLEHVTVLIGIAVGTKAVAGVIHQPYYGYKESEDCGRTIWGLVGLGAYGHTTFELPNDRVIITTTRSHSNAMVEKAINALKPDEVLRVGGAGHKVRSQTQNSI